MQTLVANLISAFVGSLATVLFVNLLIGRAEKRSREPAERVALIAALAPIKKVIVLMLSQQMR